MSDIRTSLLSRKTWIRIAYMALFLLLLILARSVLLLLILIQTGIVVTSGTDNEKLRELGQSLSKWVFQTLMFVTFNSEKKSYPFDDWPEPKFSEGYKSGNLEPIFEDQKRQADNNERELDENSEASQDVPSFTDSAMSQDSSMDDKPSDIDSK